MGYFGLALGGLEDGGGEDNESELNVRGSDRRSPSDFILAIGTTFPSPCDLVSPDPVSPLLAQCSANDFARLCTRAVVATRRSDEPV